MKWIAAIYGIVSLFTIILYGWDKRRAIKGGSRVPERTLHLAELCGGWPGALLAQKMFRHKTQKASFRRVFWAVVCLHIAAWGAWLYFNPPWE
jgi:uncharacterized membrane protein YsdA (DUF1294 family)